MRYEIKSSAVSGGHNYPLQAGSSGSDLRTGEEHKLIIDSLLTLSCRASASRRAPHLTLISISLSLPPPPRKEYIKKDTSPPESSPPEVQGQAGNNNAEGQRTIVRRSPSSSALIVLVNDQWHMMECRGTETVAAVSGLAPCFD